VSLAGAFVAPLTRFAVSGMNIPGVGVIEHAAALLLGRGSPQEPPAPRRHRVAWWSPMLPGGA
jgi:hypothetical protein